MCSRFMTGAALTVALLVSCVGNAASAVKSEKKGGGVEAPVATEARTPVPTNDAGSPALVFEGRYYNADMVWENGCVRIRDLTVPGRTRPMPLVDGSAWGSPQVEAGIYFMESIPGIGLNKIRCGQPDSLVKGDKITSCDWDDAYGDRSFRLRMDESSVTIEGYDPKTGEPTDNWFLSLIAAREKSYDLPFSVIVPQRVSAMQGNAEYHLDIATGTVALNSEDTPPVFNIYPSNGTITLRFDQGN